MPRPRPAGLTEQTRVALFIFTAARDAGFELRAAGAGRLQVLGPPDMDAALCQPVIEAVRRHGPEILRLIKWFNAERRQGRFWRPPPERRTPQ